ncbi:hypothetical protein GCM10010980_07340 [Corynebacterium marinum]|nr:hypothetical protein GCM10010980_07340 [Corynebacterium marinum]
MSEARFKPYFEECGGSEDDAWRPYEWNARVSSALSECIHHVKVLLRNAMIAELETLHPLQYPWHSDNSTIHQIAQKKRRSAGVSADPDDIIANLNLGYWQQFLQDKPADNEDLWRTTLRRAFPTPAATGRLSSTPWKISSSCATGARTRTLFWDSTPQSS